MKNYKGYSRMPYCEPHYPKTVATVVTDTPEMQRVAQNTKYQSQHKYHEEYEKMKGQKLEVTDDPEIARHMKNTKAQSNVNYHGEIERKQKQETARPQQDADAKPSSPEPVKVGSIADFDPVNGQHGSIGGQKQEKKPAGKDIAAPTKPTETEQAATEVKSTTKKTKKTKTTGFSVKALYDYSASDTDEISFKEGDVIVNCQTVDEGWLTGTIQTTLKSGMLPANYVQKIIEKTGQFKIS